MIRLSQLITHLYGLLLRMYPLTFRTEFEPDEGTAAVKDSRAPFTLGQNASKSASNKGPRLGHFRAWKSCTVSRMSRTRRVPSIRPRPL